MKNTVKKIRIISYVWVFLLACFVNAMLDGPQNTLKITINTMGVLALIILFIVDIIILRNLNNTKIFLFSIKKLVFNCAFLLIINFIIMDRNINNDNLANIWAVIVLNDITIYLFCYYYLIAKNYIHLENLSSFIDFFTTEKYNSSKINIILKNLNIDNYFSKNKLAPVDNIKSLFYIQNKLMKIDNKTLNLFLEILSIDTNNKFLQSVVTKYVIPIISILGIYTIVNTCYSWIKQNIDIYNPLTLVSIIILISVIFSLIFTIVIPYFLIRRNKRKFYREKKLLIALIKSAIASKKIK